MTRRGFAVSAPSWPEGCNIGAPIIIIIIIMRIIIRIIIVILVILIIIVVVIVVVIVIVIIIMENNNDNNVLGVMIVELHRDRKGILPVINSDPCGS